MHKAQLSKALNLILFFKEILFGLHFVKEVFPGCRINSVKFLQLSSLI